MIHYSSKQLILLTFSTTVFHYLVVSFSLLKTFHPTQTPDNAKDHSEKWAPVFGSNDR